MWQVPFDLKRFWNARPGLTGWVILNISYLATRWHKKTGGAKRLRPACTMDASFRLPTARESPPSSETMRSSHS